MRKGNTQVVCCYFPPLVVKPKKQEVESVEGNIIYSRFTFIEAVVVHVSVHVDVFSSGQGQFHLGVVVRAVIGIVAGDN